ncbi:MAG: tRNA (adenosine(37)-N6)-dimethylallyltransferase MiaA [Clostridiales bacterium]|nr:tRNA (adenosine(37)-N6)-dimethylallyltransferase MiaA [Clostridiales bacterium]
MKKTKLIVVAGPTASGKTKLAIEIAKAVSGEIISADSMQVYKGMEIATAAPNSEEQGEAVHHLIEFLDTDENFSVSDFCALARKKISEIISRGNVPIVAGGTGLFIDSLVDNVKFTDTQTDFKLRESLMQKSAWELYERLAAVDKQAAEKIHINNKIRIARALEIYYTSGKTKSFQDEHSKKEESPYETLYFVLGYKNRDNLYSRINRRVDKMVKAGLVEEAKNANAANRGTSAQAIGHKELEPYFKGEISLNDAVDNLKKATRRYAKRQITWFKRRENAVWLFADELGEKKSADEAIRKSRDFLNEKE